MKKKIKIKILLPWNLPEYCVSSDFCELYDFILDSELCNLQAINLPKFYGKKYLKYLSLLSYLCPDFRNYNNSSSVSYFLKRLAGMSCKVEILHTSPIFASKSKPFIFHLENFQSIFLHRDTSRAFKGDVDLKKIFEYESCLGIVSHIPETLESFRNYFKSPIIDSKLHYHKIALSRNFTESVKKIKITKSEGCETVFLFSLSDHQNKNNYIASGLKIVINFAKKVIASGYKAKFIFKCTKLSRSDFLDIGLSDEQIDFVHNCQSIVWYGGFLSDQELNILYKSSDFFLSPSVNLQSMDILKSMYCGSIPVVTDTVGIDQYVSHLKNGVILKGVRKSAFQDEASLLKANIANYLSLEDDLTEQLFSNVTKIMDDDLLLKKMRREVAARVVTEGYDSRFAGDDVMEYVLKQYVKNKNTNRKKKNKIISLIGKMFSNFVLSSDVSFCKKAVKQKLFEWRKIKVFRYRSRFYISNKDSCFDNVANFPRSYGDILEVNREIRNNFWEPNKKNKQN